MDRGLQTVSRGQKAGDSRQNAPVWTAPGLMSVLRLLPTTYCLLPIAFRLLLHGRPLNWISRALPRCQSTQQSRRVIDSFGFEFEHRPGTRVFVRSSTVSSNQLVAR